MQFIKWPIDICLMTMQPIISCLIMYNFICLQILCRLWTLYETIYEWFCMLYLANLARSQWLSHFPWPVVAPIIFHHLIGFSGIVYLSWECSLLAHIIHLPKIYNEMLRQRAYLMRCSKNRVWNCSSNSGTA